MDLTAENCGGFPVLSWVLARGVPSLTHAMFFTPFEKWRIFTKANVVGDPREKERLP